MFTKIFIISILFSSLPPDCDCITDGSNPKIKNIISSLKEKWDNIKSIETKYILVMEDYKKNCFKQYNIDFKLQGDNLYYAFSTPTKEVISNYDIKNSNISDIPKNLWEALVKRINRKKQKTLSLENYEYVTNASYFFEGKFYHRIIFENRNGKNYVIAFPLHRNPLLISFIHPGILWGAVLYRYKNEEHTIPYRLDEFFEQKGNFCYQEKGNYKILWHEAYLDKNDNQKTSIEVWLDEEDNLVKVKHISYIGRTYFDYIEKVKRIIGKVSCDYPQDILDEIIYSKFHPIWKIPLRMEISSYSHIFPENFDLTKLYKEYESGNISRVEYVCRILSLSQGKKEDMKIIMDIDENSLNINIPIDDKDFIPPPINKGYDLEKNESKIETTKHLKAVLLSRISLIGIFLILIIIILSLYKKFISKEKHIY